MKAQLSVVVVLASCLTACGGGGSGGHSCDEICDHIVGCEWESDKTECMDTCKSFDDLMRPSAYDVTGDCILGKNCTTVDATEVCIQEAASKTSDSVLDYFIGRLCSKMITCDPIVTVEQCTSELRGVDDLMMLRILKDTVLDCIATCIDGKDCATAQDELGDCSAGCGFIIED